MGGVKYEIEGLGINLVHPNEDADLYVVLSADPGESTRNGWVLEVDGESYDFEDSQPSPIGGQRYPYWSGGERLGWGLGNVRDRVPVALLYKNPPPVVAADIPAQSVVAGNTFSFDLPTGTFSDPLNDPLTYTASVDGTALTDPATGIWLAFDGTTFSGTPTQVAAGDITVTVKADDGPGRTDGEAGRSVETSFVVTVIDKTMPVLTSASVNRDTLTLTYDEPLDETSTPPPTAFTVWTVDDATVNVSEISVSDVTVSGATVGITLFPAVSRGQKVRIKYVSLSDSPIRDTSRNNAAGLTKQEVANATPLDDTVPPVLNAVALSPNGAMLTLTYDETLDTTPVPAANAFTVTADGTALPASSVSVSVSSMTVVLTLNPAIAHGQEVTLSYTAPGANPIRDTAQNPAANVTNRAVSNPVPPPVASITGGTASEGLPVKFTVTLSAPSAETVTLGYGTSDESDDTATAGVDYTAQDSTLTLAPMATEGTISINTIADTHIEGEETFTVTLKNPVNATLGPNLKATGRITDLDNVLPVLQSSAVVSSDTLMLTYNEALNEDSVPDTGDFRVTAGGVGVTVSGVSVTGTAVTLTLTIPPVVNGQQVRVSYTRGSSPIEDVAGNDAADLGGQVATDDARPVLQSAMLNGDTLTLTYDEALNEKEASVPNTDDFTVTADGSTVTVSDVSVTGMTVALTLTPGSVITNGRPVALTYTAGARPIKDLTGNAAANLTGQVVLDRTVPVLQSAMANGKTLTLTYDEALNGASIPGAGDFTVTADSSEVEVSGVEVSGAEVRLTLTTTLLPSHELVAVSYTSGSKPIEDVAGNAAANLSGQSAQNNTQNISVTIKYIDFDNTSGGKREYHVNEDSGTPAVVTLAIVDADGERVALSGDVTLRTGTSAYTGDNVIFNNQPATADRDYTPVDTEVTIRQGETTATFNVAIIDDELVERNEYLGLATMAWKGSAPVFDDFEVALETLTPETPQPVIRIASDDIATVSLDSASYEVTEGQTLDLVLNFSHDVQFGFDLDFSLSQPINLPDVSEEQFILTYGSFTANNQTTYTARYTSGVAAAQQYPITLSAADDNLVEGPEPDSFNLLVQRQPGINSVFNFSETLKNDDTLVNIIDNDVAELGLEALPDRIVESGGVSTIRVSTTNNVTFRDDQEITLSLTGSATEGTDYTIASKTLTLKAGESSVETTLRTVGDNIDDNFETIFIDAQLDGDGRLAPNTINQEWIIIYDDIENTAAEGVPTLSDNVLPMGTVQVGEVLSADISGIRDDNGLSRASYTYRWFRQGDATGTDAQVITDETGSAYQLLSAADVGKYIAVEASFNDDAGNPETVRSEGIGPVGKATLTITPASQTVNEDVGTIEYSVALSPATVTTGGPLAISLTSSITPADASRRGNENIVGNFPVILEFLKGVTSPQTHTVDIDNDNRDEVDEVQEVTASFVGGPIAPLVEIAGTATATVRDDDDPPELEMSVSSDTIAENGGASTLTVRSTNGYTFPDDKTFALMLTGTATEGTDYTIGSMALMLAAGESAVETTIEAVDNIANTGDRTIGIAIADYTHITDSQTYSITGSGAEITITEDDNSTVTGTVTVTGVAQVGQMLTAAASDITDADDFDDTDSDGLPDGYTWQWLRVDSTDETAIMGATSNTYTLQAVDEGKQVKAQISFTDKRGDGETLASAAYPLGGTVTTTRAPELAEVTVTGDTLTLTYDEVLDRASVPAADDFEVRINNVMRALDSTSPVAVSGQTVILTLASPAFAPQQVRLDYTVGASPIRDEDGNTVAALTNQAVTNDTPRPTVITGRFPQDWEFDVNTNHLITRWEFIVAFNFSQDVTGLDVDDFTVQNGEVRDIEQIRSSYSVFVAATGAHGDEIKVTLREDAVDQGNAETTYGPYPINAPPMETDITTEATEPVTGRFRARITFNQPVPDLINEQSPEDTRFPRDRHFDRSEDLRVTNGSPPRAGAFHRDWATVTAKRVFDFYVRPKQNFEGTLTVFLPQGQITSESGNDNPYASLDVEVDTLGPEVVSIAPIPPEDHDGVYAEGETIALEVTFHEAIVLDDTPPPTLKIDVGGTERTATYDADRSTAAGDTKLVFTYEVTDSDQADGGIRVAANKLTAEEIKDEHDNTANLEHDAYGPWPYHRVDTAAPVFQMALVTGGTLTLTYDETLDADSTPPGSAFTVSVDGTDQTPSAVAVAGRVVTLTLATEVTRSDGVTVSYRQPSGADATPLQDLAGNPAAALTDEDVTNTTGQASVSYGQASYTVNEGEDVTVTVTLSAEPGRVVEIPLSEAGGGGAGADDYSGVPASLSFGAAETEKSFTITAAEDSFNDSGEFITLGFGTLPSGISAGTVAVAVVNITDVPDTTAPLFVSGSAAVTSKALTLTFDKALDEDQEPAGSAFTVTVTGIDNTERTTTVSGVSVADTVVTLTLAEAVIGGETVTVLYADPGADPRLKDTVGNPVATFTTRMVTNSSPECPATTGQPDGTFWTACLGVGRTGDNTGYNTTSATYGSLSGDDFTFPDGDNEVLAVFRTVVGSTTSFTIEFKNALTDAQKNRFVLKVGDTSLNFSESRVVAGNDLSRVSWIIGRFTVSWAEGQKVSVSLSAPNSPATGTPGISGTAELDAVLTADAGDIADLDGLPDATFPTDYNLQWVRVDGATEADISGETGATYTLTDDDLGKQVRVKVSFTDRRGTGETRASVAYPPGGTVVADATPPMLAPDTPPEVNGAELVLTFDEALDTASIPDKGAFTVQIGGDTGPSVDNVSVAGTKVTLTLSAAVGFGSGQVTVSYTDPGADPRLKDTGGNPVATFSEDVTNATPKPVLALSVDPVEIAEDAGTSTVTVEITNGVTFAADQTITLAFDGSTATKTDDFTIADESLTLTAGTSSVTTTVTAVQDTVDEDPDETVVITATHDGTEIGTATITILDDDNSPATGAPEIEGDAFVGVTLTARTGDMADADDLPSTEFPMGYSFQWVRLRVVDGSPVSPGEEPIQDAISQTYTPVAADAGYYIAVRVSFEDGAANTETLVSEPVGPVVDSTAAPEVTSIERQTPSSSPTNADSLTWRVTFNEDVKDVDAADFTLSGSTATLTVSAATASTVYDVTAAGGDLAGLNATATLGFSDRQNIKDSFDNALTTTTPTGTDDNTYVVDNIQPSVTITGVPATSSAAFSATFSFSEAVTGFAMEDVTVGNGAASDFSVTRAGEVWTALITPSATGTVTMEMAAGVATDLAGNENMAAPLVSSTYTSPVAGVSVSPTSLSVNESGTTTYTVVLTTEPSGTVTVTPSSGDTGAATLSPSSLTFTSGNWDTAQTVTVSGEEDDDANDETVAISHSVSGYGSVTTAAEVSVTVSDNDTAGVSVSPTSLSVEEGGTTTYTVVLNTEPSSTVTVTPSSGDTGAATLSPSSLTFTSGNWDTAQTVTVSGQEDDDVNDETVAISHNVSGYGSVTTAAEVSVTVNDNDTAVVSVSPTSLSVNESGTTTYTVVLTTEPSSTVTVTPSSNDTGAATLSPSSLTFTSGNWKTAQTVTVSGQEDDDVNDETVAISHSVSGYGSVTTAADVSVTVNDNDTAGVSVSPTSLSVNESGTTTYTVVLTTEPSSTVTVTPSSGDTGAATLSPSSLTFTSGNWKTAQTVTVSGQEDDDVNNETVAISHSVSGYGSVTTAANVSVTVNDNDTAGVSVSPTSLSVNESGTTTYTVVLTTEPSGTVTVTPSSGDTGAATLSPSSLTFTSGNWDTAQTVTVSGEEDDDVNNETVAISHSVSGYGSVTTAAEVSVTVSDNDTAGVSVSPTSLSVNEGGTTTYTVVLNTEPSSTVTVTPSSGDTGTATLSPSSLTFTSGNWDTAQTVTVSGAEDDDANDETVAISHNVSGYGSVTTAANVSVTVNDNDTAGVSVSPTSLSVNESGTTTYTVVLTTEPNSTVTVTPSSGDTGAATLSPSSLTFTSGNWKTAQTVTVSGEEDDDVNNETVAISHSVSGYGSVTTAAEVSVTVSDNDTAGVSVSPTSLSVNESGTTTYTVVLTTEPSSTVTVTPSSSDTGTATLSPSSLTFTSGNWDTAQTVTVSGAEDDDANDETVAISHSVSGYGSVTTAANVSVTVSDNDTAGVSVSPTSLSVNESGTTTYTVVLTTEPSGTVTVTPSSGDTGAATLSPSSLTFTSGNWDTAQTVTVSGQEDDDVNNETVAISHSVSGYGSVTTAAEVRVTVNDNDTAGVSVSPTSLSVNESGTTTYTVVLTTEPSGTVTVTPSSGDTGAATLSPSSLTFTSGNWKTAQTVTVSGEEDDDVNNETVAISHSVSGYGSVTTAAEVSVTVSDNDTAGVSISPTSLSVNESGTTTYTVVLTTEPSGTVTVTPSSGDTGAATLSPSSLTFTSGNWKTAQTVTVSGEEDDDANDETVAISHSVSGYGSVTTAAEVSVTVSDNDTAGVSVSPTSLSVNESGTTTYTVVLNTEPSSTVIVTPSSGDTGAATLSPSSLTFTSGNWDTAQTVTVSGEEDNDVNNETVAISHSVSGYGSVTTAAEVSVTVSDNDTAGVSVSPTSLSVNESGTTTYTVVLNTEPSGTVTVTPSSGDTGAATLSPSSLTFTSGNWKTAQTVTVSGEEDDDVNNETVAISHSVSGYGSVTTAAEVSVTVSDNDTAGVSVSPTSLSVEEGGMTTYTVVLNTEPSGTVTVTPSSGDTGAATLSPSSLTFTSGNWDTAQTVTVSGEEDDDANDETVAISHSVSGYGSVTTAAEVSVTVNDNDTAGVSVSPTSLSVEEGGMTTYTVVLTTEPSGTVTVTPSSNDTGAATLSPSASPSPAAIGRRHRPSRSQGRKMTMSTTRPSPSVIASAAMALSPQQPR